MRKEMKGALKRTLCLSMSLVMMLTLLPMGAGAAEAGPEKAVSAESVQLEAVGEENSTVIEVNQGFSAHTGLNDGNETYMNDFVAGKQTVVMFKVPGSAEFTEEQAKQAVANYKLEAKAVTNGTEADNNELTADSFSVKRAYDNDCDIIQGWYATANFPKGPDKGTYNFHLKNGDTEIAVNKGVNFYETTKLNILVAPVKGYWGGAYPGGASSAGAYSCKEGKFFDTLGNEKEWSSLLTELKTYLLDVYPIAEVNFEEANEIDASDASYDMCNGDGQKKLWEEACKLQSKTKDGKDRYDLILAFVQYRQDQGGGQGYTFGKPTNIITYSDKDMLPTVAHEIAHCYQVGDEYDGGSFNSDVNFPPNGYKGRNYVNGADIAASEGACDYWKAPKQYKSSSGEASKKAKVEENGLATMVPLSLRPYSLAQDKFICWYGVNPADGSATGETVYPTLSYMGSGYSGCDGYYFTSSVIWDHLFKQFVVKEKKEESQQQEEQPQQEEQSQELTNAQVFLNAVSSGAVSDENAIFNESDFYYDDDCRFGESRMVEVEGWLVKDGTGVKAEMSPMFSYDGDLEYTEVLDDTYKKSSEIYTFAALDGVGNIIESPVDGELSVAEFYGGFYNPRTNGGKLQDEVSFRLDAEYPEGTSDFIIFKGKPAEDGSFDKNAVVWRASDDAIFKDSFNDNPDGYLNYAEVNSKEAEVEWEVYYPGYSDEPFDNKDGRLYTEVYYCPNGDDGEAYYVGCSEDEDWEEGYIRFETDSQFAEKWTRNAYVWIKVTNGINAVDIYSDENDITLCNSVISLSGTGIRKGTVNGETVYKASYTGNAITPNVAVKAMDPATRKYISLKKDVDFTVSFENNVNAGYATVSVQGIGLYAGKNTLEFEIEKNSLNATPDEIPDMVYTANLDSTVSPYLIMKDAQGGKLVFNKDFTVKYNVEGNESVSINKLIPSAPESPVAVTVSYFGKGGYTGEAKKKVKFNVLPVSEEAMALSNANTVITLKAAEFEYTGKPVKAAVKSAVYTDKEGNEVPLKSSDYKVVYSNNVSMGTARVTLVGKKRCTGSAYVTFEIKPKKVKSIKVTVPKSLSWTGSKIAVDSLPIEVKAGNIVLRKGLDYKVKEAAGCNYKDITTSDMKKDGKQPQVVVELIKLTDAQKASMKKSDQPVVEWDDKVADEKRTVSKPFSIVGTKLDSAAVSFSAKNKDESQNKVLNSEGKSVATLRSATKDELNRNKRKFTYVITSVKGLEDADVLDKDVDITKNAAIMEAFGKTLKAGEEADYTVSVSKTKAGKVGTITLKAVKDGHFTGKRTIKFLYQKYKEEEILE